MQQTPFYELMKEQGARFVDFCGWELPVQFKGLEQEHLAVRKEVGLFDVSHMGEFIISGNQALEAVQWVITNNAARLTIGSGVLYTVMCTPEGGIVDDLLVYRLEENKFLACVNAARVKEDFVHWTNATKQFDCHVTDISAEYAQLALQGPHAEKLLQHLVDINLSEMKIFNFGIAQVAGAPDVIVSRTGYTGEDGFELYIPTRSAKQVWLGIIEHGAKYNLSYAGLGARDTLRLEARFALYGNDIDETTTPIEAGLGWTVKFKKGPFNGSEVLKNQKKNGTTRKLMGFELQDKGIARQGYPVLVDGQEVGAVTSGTLSPLTKKAIGLAYLPIESCEIGKQIVIGIRNRHVKAVVVETPFYKRPE